MTGGLEGVVAAETILSHMDGDRGVLWVRGHTVEELVSRGYEGAVAVLWDSFAGEGLTGETVRAQLGDARSGAFARLGDWLGVATHRPPVEAARFALASLPDGSAPAEIAAALAVAVAAVLRRRGGAAPVPPDPALGVAADFLRMARGAQAAPNEVAALDTYFCAVLESGLNASAFAARVVASTRASLAAAATAGYCAFTGPLHGGAPGPTLDMLDEIEASGDVAGWIERRLESGGRLMGFGHRVFRVRDPRNDALRGALDRLSPAVGRLAFAAEVERCAVAALERRKPGRSLRMNIEINAALLLDALGLPRDAFMPVFAISRCASWLAHAIEQQKTGRMIRPSSTYVGPRPAG